MTVGRTDFEKVSFNEGAQITLISFIFDFSGKCSNFSE
jgi:hypothetical protein